MNIDRLDDIVNKYNNTYQKTVKVKPVYVKLDMCIDFNKENNNEGSKFKVGDLVRISKYKNILAKVYVSNWSEEIFGIKKVKNNAPCIYAISDLNKEKIVRTFCKKELQKTKQNKI